MKTSNVALCCCMVAIAISFAAATFTSTTDAHMAALEKFELSRNLSLRFLSLKINRSHEILDETSKESERLLSELTQDDLFKARYFNLLTQQYSHFEKEAIEKSLDVRSCIDPVRNAWKNAQIVIINEAEKCMLQKFEESRSFDLDIRSKASEITNNMFEYKYRASGCLDKSGLFPAFRTKTCLAMLGLENKANEIYDHITQNILFIRHLTTMSAIKESLRKDCVQRSFHVKASIDGTGVLNCLGTKLNDNLDRLIGAF